jgi:hypothetical protein
MDGFEKGIKLSDDYNFLGIDVQFRRPCTYYVLDQDLGFVTSGNLDGKNLENISQNLYSLAISLVDKHPGGLAVGIDAPRMGLPAPRPWYWRGGAWVPRSDKESGYGRHCEVVVKALGLGNPQWTRTESDSPDWMKLGYRLFESLEDLAKVFEVFPSASYRMLNEGKHPPIPLNLNGFAGQQKDMLDACVAAYTVWAFILGLGTEVGGGDGLGTIVLPEKLAVPGSHSVLHWPDQQESCQKSL